MFGQINRIQLFSAMSLALFAFGWAWFAVSFTAKQSEWWNSLWVGIAIYAVAVLLAIPTLPSKRGFVALSLSGFFLIMLVLLKFG